jgi:hypothetical protein
MNALKNTCKLIQKRLAPYIKYSYICTTLNGNDNIIEEVKKKIP